MITIFFDKSISHFITSIQAHGENLCLTNWHLLVLDGHNSRVTINVVHKVRRLGLGLITLPSHTSHALQHLNVACFTTFKITFKAYITNLQALWVHSKFV
jgi:hypothetical protein